jgi:DNA-binding NarL/FixJ family response regulator
MAGAAVTTVVAGTHAQIGSLKRADADWLDPIVVDRIINGDDPGRRATPLELEAAVMHLTRRGWSAAQIATWTGYASRTVTRYRAKARPA